MGNLNKLKEVTREELENTEIDGPIGVKEDYDFDELLKKFKELKSRAQSYSEDLQKRMDAERDNLEVAHKKEAIDKIIKEIFNNIKGMEGENKIKYYLSRLDMKMIVLHNLHFLDIEAGEAGHTAQIDFIIITEGKIFILESKSWSGTITIKDIDSFFVVNKENETKKIQPPSPYEQVNGQRIVLERVLMHDNKLREFFYCSLGTCFYPMVVITDTNSILEKDECNSCEVKSKIIRVDNLYGKINEVNKNEITRNVSAMKRVAKEILNVSRSPKKRTNNEYFKDYEKAYNVIDGKFVEISFGRH